MLDAADKIVIENLITRHNAVRDLTVTKVKLESDLSDLENDKTRVDLHLQNAIGTNLEARYTTHVSELSYKIDVITESIATIEQDIEDLQAAVI